jgi:hypothetical protein
MPDWNTRLAVYYNDGTNKLLTPIDSFSPTFAVSAEAMHSIEKTHIGVIYQTPQITFTMTVKAIGTAAAELTAMAMQGKEFQVILQREEGDDWSFVKILLDQCLITSAAPSSVTVSGAPSATFSGFSRSVNVEFGTQKVTLP